MRIFITGIHGFLGARLAKALEAEGHFVAGNDSFICADPKIHHDYQAECLPFDCRSAEFAAYLKANQFDVLYHCAATAHEGLSVFSPHFITQNIFEASVATFSAAIASGVKRIVYMTSMARYGGQVPPFTEDMEPKAVDPYGIAKAAGEQVLKVLCAAHGVDWVVAVPHNIIGVGQNYTDPYRNVAAIFLNRMKQGMPVFVYGDGMQRRCFSPVEDCLHSLVQMADHPGVVGEVINIGPASGGITINDLVRLCAETLQVTPNVVYLPPRPLEVREAHCSSEKARRLLGYEPQQDVSRCIAQMAAWIEPRPFRYDFPIEIDTPSLPVTWRDKLQHEVPLHLQTEAPQSAAVAGKIKLRTV